MSMDLGQLVIELVGDYSQLQKDIEAAKQMALKQAQQLENSFKISPTFDAKSLLEDASSAGADAGKVIAKSIETSLNSYKFKNSNFKLAGVAIADGLSQGISSGSAKIKSSATAMAGLIIDETRNKLKIHSPSKVFEEIGEQVIEGFVDGLGASGKLSISGFITSLINDAKSAVGATLSFAGDSINKYADFKQTEAQLTSFVGSSVAAAAQLRSLRQESDKLALPFSTAAKDFTNLTASVKGTKLEGQAPEIFNGVATAVKANGGDLGTAFGSIDTLVDRGKVTQESLKQLAKVIPDVMSIAAKSIGVTTSQLQELLKTGELTTATFLPALAKGLSDANPGAIASATDSSTSALTRLNNQLDEVKVSLGEAIEPGVIAGLGFAQTALSELGKAGLFDDLNKGAKDFASYLRENPQLAKSTADTIRGVLKSAIAETTTLSAKLLDYLERNPQAINDAGVAITTFGKSIGDAIQFAGNLLGIFQNIAKTVDDTYTKASQLLGGDSQSQDRFKKFLQYGPLSLVPGLTPGGEDSAPKPSQSPKETISASVKSQGYLISQSVGSRILPVNSYDDLAKHHPSSGVQPGRQYDIINGKLEEVRKSANSELVKKDLILQNNNGSTNVTEPSPATGYARVNQAWGGVAIYSQKVGGELLGQILHMKDILVKTGDMVKYGQPIGTQSNVHPRGQEDGIGIHSHIELPVSQWKQFVKDLQTGVFNSVAQTATPTQDVKKKLSLNASDGWMRTIASTYGNADNTNGTDTASGRKFNENELTAAINENLKKNLGVKWGDKVEAVNPANNKSVVVTITDSGPYEKKNGRYIPHPTRGFDLSTAAAKEIGLSLGEIVFRVLGKSSIATPSTLVSSITSTQLQPKEVTAILREQQLKEQEDTRKKIREATQSTTQSRRSLQDLDYSTMRNPSLHDRQVEEFQKEQQKYDDAIRDASNRREDATSRIGINSAKLSTGSVVDPEEAKDLQLQIALDKRSITELDSVIEHLGVSRANATKQLQQYQAQQRNIQQRGVNFDLRSGDNSILSSNIQGLKQLQSISPTDNRLDALPGLERELSLKQTQLELDKQLAAITDSVNKNDITPSVAIARVTQLEQENSQLVSNINLQYQASVAARELAKAKLNLSSLVRDNSSQSDFLKNDASLSEYGYGGDKLALDNQANSLDLKTKYAQDKVTLMEAARNQGFTPEQTNGEKLRLAIRNNQSNTLNNAQFQQASDDREFNNLQRLQQSNLDVLSAKSDSLQGLGLEYSSKPIQQTIAVQQQAMNYASQINDLQKLKDTTNLSADAFAQMKANIEKVNAIKLDSIQKNFSDLGDIIKGFKSSFQDTLSSFLLNSSNLGQSLGSLLQSLFKNISQIVSQSLSDEVFGSIFGTSGVQGSTGASNKPGSIGSLLGGIGSIFGIGSKSTSLPINSGGFDKISSNIGSLIGLGNSSSNSPDYSSFLQQGGSSGSFNLLSALTKWQGSSSGGGVGLPDLTTLFGSTASPPDYSAFLGGSSDLDSFGLIPNFASGSSSGLMKSITDALQRERSQSGGLSPSLAVINDHETVLNPSESAMYKKILQNNIPNYASGSGNSDLLSGMPTYQAGGTTISMGDFHINTGNNSTQVNVPQLQKVLQAQIQATIKNERRPGGSLNTNAPGLYDR